MKIILFITLLGLLAVVSGTPYRLSFEDDENTIDVDPTENEVDAKDEDDASNDEDNDEEGAGESEKEDDEVSITKRNACYRNKGGCCYNRQGKKLSCIGTKPLRRSQNFCLKEHNAARSSNGKKPLTYDSRLETAARNHNSAMIKNNCFEHRCPGEYELGQRIPKTGYKSGGVAENIIVNQADCKSAVKGWMNSSGHRKNILGDYKNIGCVVAECKNCNYKTYWTCVFGKTQ